MRSTVGIPSFPRKRWPKAKAGEDVKAGIRAPKRGELKSGERHAAYMLWLTRDVEPEWCDPMDWCDGREIDAVRQSEIEQGADLFRLAEDRLTRPLWVVIVARYKYGLTLEEIGVAFGVTRERIRQIEHKALRALRRAVQAHPEAYPQPFFTKPWGIPKAARPQFAREGN